MMFLCYMCLGIMIKECVLMIEYVWGLCLFYNIDLIISSSLWLIIWG